MNHSLNTPNLASIFLLATLILPKMLAFHSLRPSSIHFGNFLKKLHVLGPETSYMIIIRNISQPNTFYMKRSRIMNHFPIIENHQKGVMVWKTNFGQDFNMSFRKVASPLKIAEHPIQPLKKCDDTHYRSYLSM